MLLEILRLICLATAAGALLAAAVHDIRSYEIPNRFPAAIALAFVAISFTGDLHAALSGLALGTIVFAVGVVCFARRWLGGGDVKLLGAIALWVSIPLIASFALVTSLAGAVLGIIMMTPLRRHFPAPPEALAAAAGSAGAMRQPMPFGAAIATGGLFALVARMTT